MKRWILPFLLCLLLCAPALAEGSGTPQFYATVIHYSGEDDSEQKYLEISARSEALFALLEQNADAFIMDGYNYLDIDGEGTPLYTMNDLSLPVDIDSAGHSIGVSMNYFLFNPIETANGQSIEEQLVRDDNVWNILVPEHLREYEADILSEYLDDFYFRKVTAANYSNEEAGLPLLKTTEDELSVHIIYVKDNRITDPIAYIYTGNIHQSYAHSYLSQFAYFPSEAEDAEQAYAQIEPYVRQVGAEDSVQSVRPVSEDFSETVIP
ncbi:MAG: hypothetical protein Q4E13_01780 [Clostridia bacterium]|nr:hypothetical protein [Clostridia bacterium]